MRKRGARERVLVGEKGGVRELEREGRERKIERERLQIKKQKENSDR